MLLQIMIFHDDSSKYFSLLGTNRALCQEEKYSFSFFYVSSFTCHSHFQKARAITYMC